MKHFVSVDQFEAHEFEMLAKRALMIKNNEVTVDVEKMNVVNMFFENSTRTKMSFEMAEAKLGWERFNFDVSTSSVNKGETLFDSVATMQAIGMDVAVMRHEDNNYYGPLLEMGISIVNAGSGSGSHPSQSLLDIMTILENFNQIEGLNIVIVGDLKHSRVARSNARLLQRLGANVYYSGPSNCYDEEFEAWGTFIELDEIISTVDVVMLLRIQFERHRTEYITSNAMYLERYGMCETRYNKMKNEAIIMHPAPVNRDVEIADKLVLANKSRIMAQMENGVYARMAILEWIRRD